MIWLSVDSLPKDGSLILVYIRQGITSSRHGTHYWYKVVPVAYCRIEEKFRVYAPNWSGYIPEHIINGWMKLPNPPEVIPT